MPNSPFSGESREHLLNRGSSEQTHLSASSVLTAHPAATTAACATLAKGVCTTAVTIDKVAKKALSESESTAAKSVVKSNSTSESKVIENK